MCEPGQALMSASMKSGRERRRSSSRSEEHTSVLQSRIFLPPNRFQLRKKETLGLARDFERKHPAIPSNLGSFRGAEALGQNKCRARGQNSGGTGKLFGIV